MKNCFSVLACCLSLGLLAAPVAQAGSLDPPIDIVLTLDASASVDPTEFDQLRTAVSSVISFVDSDLNLGNGPQNSRIGLVSYANDAKLSIPLTGDLRTLQAGTNGLSGTMGTTNTEDAIRKASQELLSKKRAPDAVSWMVLITDGDPNDFQAAVDAAAQVRNLFPPIDALSVIQVGSLIQDDLTQLAGPTNPGTLINYTPGGSFPINPLEQGVVLAISDYSQLEGAALQLFGFVPPVPEPSAAVLLLAGLGGFAVRRKRNS
ncbi:von Willebrand factor type A domain protein [Planctomycetes bacterium MalM25]|nr:von Willebrand factor type A domain protein [Planctomycetes bacterium MalM25]